MITKWSVGVSILVLRQSLSWKEYLKYMAPLEHTIATVQYSEPNLK